MAELLGNVGPEHSRGESSFRDQLGGVVDAFLRAGLAREDDGAIVVPFADRERPLLIRKRDGGFLYATTDLAGVRFRVQRLDGERVVYVVDARQRDHFRDVFDAARLIGWNRLNDGEPAELVHVGFGTVLGKDKKPLKTRSGENFTLMALLEEAIERGRTEVRRRAADVDSPTHGMSERELDRIGQAVGIAAIKYADLGTDLVKDYVFDLDRMIAFEGDTGPYLLYAHARICSILGRADAAGGGAATGAASGRPAPLLLREPAERALALALLRYPQVLHDVARSLEPHRLCSYLRSLAEQFSAFYGACPVLKADDDSVRRSRLRLCELTRRVLRDGLGVLGVDAPERM
ncbi:MAG: arginine--tRNA ligase [Phycisphaerales bacterium]